MRSKLLLSGVKTKRRYWNFKDEELDLNAWGNGFGRGY